MRFRLTSLAALLIGASSASVAAPPVPTRVSTKMLTAICAENPAACLTYVMSAIDTTQNAAAAAGVRVNYCIPAAVRNDQISDAVLRYLRAHAELANENAASAVLTALRDSFPCP